MKTNFARRLGITRQTLANKLKTPNLPLDFILRAGKILRYSFFREIPEMNQFKESALNDTLTPYKSIAADKSEENWKNKYMKLLEEYNDCLREKEDASLLLAGAINGLRNVLKNYLKKTKTHC